MTLPGFVPGSVWTFAQRGVETRGVTRVSIMVIAEIIEIKIVGTAEGTAFSAEERIRFAEVEQHKDSADLLLDIKIAGLRRIIKDLAFKRFGFAPVIQF